MKLFQTKTLDNPHVNPSPLGRRIGAFLIDVFASVLLMFLAYNSLLYPLWYQHLGGEEAHIAFAEAKWKSGLYSSPYVTVVTDQGEISVFDEARPIDTSALYKADSLRVDRFTPSSDLTADFRIVGTIADGTEREVYYFAALSTYYHQDNPYFQFLNSNYYSGTNTTFEFLSDVFELASEESLFIYQGEQQNQITIKPNVGDDEVLKKVKDIYERARVNLEKTTIYRKLRQPIANINIWGHVACFDFGLLIFTLLFPLLFGDGRSLGKYFLGLGLVNDEGYKISFWQVLVRYLVIALIEVALSVVLFVLPLLISSAFFALNKRRKSLHDFAARTIVIDWNNSRIFVSEEEALLWKEKRELNQECLVKPTGGLTQTSSK